ncbi:lipopolysaccharide core heptose(II) kinase RfaY [Mangrovibacter plantisponsor]|uniref:Heptose II phosphotransferase n=1 Tax=Mangrovibacter plantisponsor TaxID=451513 RepID=A0A317PZV5_9ENTR|nr:lipopolysaccharide core heptose(II) kinase RfaY [Mangrovibacter plantisponsor]PWW07828.1 heptose II phosphotransferase [Mangrovibacter plantisponsor]
MIQTGVYKGYQLHFKAGRNDYCGIFKSMLSLNARLVETYKCSRHTRVSLIEIDKKLYVIKIYSPQRKRVEKFIKSLFRGSYNENLIRKIDSAHDNGCMIPNDFFLLAEKKILSFPYLSIMLLEFIPGDNASQPNNMPTTLSQKIISAVTTMHSQGIISGDPHKGNFIITAKGDIRAIDLSGKACNAKNIAKDFTLMKKIYGLHE